MKTQKTKNSGFTLIEMLVVIAIIALLAAILVPAVTGALDNANRTRTLANGRAIFQSVISADLEDPIHGVVEFWPTSENLTPSSPNTPDTSTTGYFNRLIVAQALNEDFSLFSAPRVPPAQAMPLTTANNAWRVVQDVSKTSPSQTPFLITRNLPALNLGTDDADFRATVTGEPFQNRGLVVVRIGGGGEVLQPNAMRWNVLNPPGNADVILPN